MQMFVCSRIFIRRAPVPVFPAAHEESLRMRALRLAEREGFEPSVFLYFSTLYTTTVSESWSTTAQIPGCHQSPLYSVIPEASPNNDA